MQLNMFRASSCSSSGATTTALAASGLPLELGDSSAVGRGRANSTITKLLYLLHLVRVIKSKRKRWAGHVARVNRRRVHDVGGET
jgi:hypothetical protein